jgi:hypothetical protein
MHSERGRGYLSRRRIRENINRPAMLLTDRVDQLDEITKLLPGSASDRSAIGLSPIPSTR